MAKITDFWFKIPIICLKLREPEDTRSMVRSLIFSYFNILEYLLTELM